MKEETYKIYLENLINGNREVCAEMLAAELESSSSIREVYTHTIQRSLYDVGMMWEKNEISVSVEHLATAVTESLLNNFIDYIVAVGHKRRTAVITCCEGELHQVGGRIVADYIEFKGWQSFFLGSDTPASALADFAYSKKPDILGISVSIYSNLKHLPKIIDEVLKVRPEQKILVGGQAFRWGKNPLDGRYDSVVHISGLDELDAFMDENYGE